MNFLIPFVTGISYRNGYAQSGIFISRLVAQGIAESTNLLHPNDEILEVNGIIVSSSVFIRTVFFVFNSQSYSIPTHNVHIVGNREDPRSSNRYNDSQFI